MAQRLHVKTDANESDEMKMDVERHIMQKLKRWRQTILIGTSLLFLLSAGRASAYAQSPIHTLKRTNEQINRLLRKEKAKSSNKTKIQESLKKAINRFLDFRELARLALARHWTTRSEAERAEFVSILRQLIEKSYLKQLRSNVEYKIDYRSEKVTGNTARVITTIMVDRDGRPEEVTIEYKMRRGKSWMVYDVVTDDVSIVRNYRSQFNRIIRTKSYEKLVEKMRRKLETI